MITIFKAMHTMQLKNMDMKVTYMAGANIAGFLKVADAYDVAGYLINSYHVYRLLLSPLTLLQRLLKSCIYIFPITGFLN